jgi:hypothetical protein
MKVGEILTGIGIVRVFRGFVNSSGRLPESGKEWLLLYWADSQDVIRGWTGTEIGRTENLLKSEMSVQDIERIPGGVDVDGKEVLMAQVGPS